MHDEPPTGPPPERTRIGRIFAALERIASAVARALDSGPRGGL